LNLLNFIAIDLQPYKIFKIMQVSFLQHSVAIMPVWCCGYWLLQCRTDFVFCFIYSHSTVDTLAREIFAEVGNKLQQRRMKDFMQNFGSHLTDEYRCVCFTH